MEKKEYIKPIISDTIFLSLSGMMAGSFSQSTGDAPDLGDDVEGASENSSFWDDDE